jgi:hypothetical protein
VKLDEKSKQPTTHGLRRHQEAQNGESTITAGATTAPENERKKYE